jgi:hypothetical protein
MRKENPSPDYPSHSNSSVGSNHGNFREESTDNEDRGGLLSQVELL